MFLTDGGNEDPKELFEQYNPNKTVCAELIVQGLVSDKIYVTKLQ